MLESTHKFRLKDQDLYLLPEKALYWENRKILMIADFHMGKSTHFRKAGIPIPSGVSSGNLEKLGKLFQEWKPEMCLFLGDLFHSTINPDWGAFLEWKNQFHEMDFILVKGNHDLFQEQVYKDAGLHLHGKTFVIPPFVFAHKSQEELDPFEEQYYCFAGHTHPAVKLYGRGDQSITLPCFYFSLTNAILPAFGEFTGFSVIKPTTEDTIFVIAEDKVIPISNS